MPKFIKLTTKKKPYTFTYHVNVEHIAVFANSPSPDEDGNVAMVGVIGSEEALSTQESAEKIDKMIRGIDSGDNKA